MRKATPSQQEAIGTLEKNLLVSAGAGSGKTTVLVSRFLRMVAGDIANGSQPTAPVDGVLTITFTDKAAGEMRERIASALASRGLVDERRQLEVAYISTIHGFCRRLLQENPFEAALDPKFTTLDGARAALIREECFDKVIEQAFAKGDQEIINLVLICQEAPDRDASGDVLAPLRAAVTTSFDAMRSLGQDTSDLQKWIDAGVEGILQRTASLIEQPLAEKWSAVVEAARPLLEMRLTGPAEEARRIFDEFVRAASPIARGESLASLAERAEQLRALNPTMPRPRREYDAHAFSVLKDAILQIREQVNDPLIQEFSLAREHASAAQSLAFLRLVRAVWQAYDAAKEEISALDFNDLQLKARRLLEMSDGVRRRYRRKFRYLMVDEFQDTDRLQKSIIDLLRGENNFFVVGDVKQSIYGWRNADVRLFLGLDQEFTAAQATQPDRYRRLSLAENFRSRPEVLTFVNTVFREMWDAHGDSPTSVPFQALDPRGAFMEKQDPSVEILLVPPGSAAERRAAEAELIARRLKEIHGTLPLTSERRESDTVRWSDCLILLRALTNVDIYVDALTRHGIPHFIVGGRGYYARREIRDLVCLLRVINSPMDDVATAAVLRSPFASVSMDAVTVLARRARQMEGYPSLYRAIKDSWEDEEMPAEDRPVLQRFYTLVERLRGKSDRVKPGWLLDEALAETHYDARVLSRGSEGRRTLANVRKLVQMANAYAAPDVAGLVRHLESLSMVSTDEGDAPSYSEAADVVRIMTVHKAKGLESPVVVVPDLSRPLRAQGSGLVALDAQEGIIGSKVAEGAEWKPSVALTALDSRRADKEREESERLLYVALTRAQEHLILAGPVPPGRDTWGECLYGYRLPFAGVPATPTVTELPSVPDLLVRVEGLLPEED